LSPRTTIVTTVTHTRSLHDALPISSFTPAGYGAIAGTIGSRNNSPETWKSACAADNSSLGCSGPSWRERILTCQLGPEHPREELDRKSTRLNSSHQIISYAVFCLKK